MACECSACRVLSAEPAQAFFPCWRSRREGSAGPDLQAAVGRLVRRGQASVRRSPPHIAAGQHRPDLWRVHTGLRQNETDLAGGCQSPVAHLTNVSAQDVDATKTLVEPILGNDQAVLAKDFTNGHGPDAVAQGLILITV